MDRTNGKADTPLTLAGSPVVRIEPLFVSYAGNMSGKFSKGWVVLENHPPLVRPEDMMSLVSDLEQARGYDKGTMILVSFQRLESASRNVPGPQEESEE